MSPADTSIRIVYLEDDPSAFALVQALLADDGLLCVLENVEDEPGYTRALHPRAPDLILADFSLPTMDGLKALALKRHLCPTTPFIFVSGALGETVAINALKHGATDFVLKDSLARLPEHLGGDRVHPPVEAFLPFVHDRLRRCLEPLALGRRELGCRADDDPRAARRGDP